VRYRNEAAGLPAFFPRRRLSVFRAAHLFVLGVLAFASTARGRFVIRSRHQARLTIHLGMGASYILLLTAFYVDNGKNLPLWKDLPSISYWTFPALVGIPIIVRTMLRRPLRRRRSRRNACS
jgi:hypothetical protein